VAAVLDAIDVRAHYRTRAGGAVRAVDGVSFALSESEVLGIAGESGCGKSTLAPALAGLFEPPLYRAGGRVLIEGDDLYALDRRRLRLEVLGRRIACVPQSAMNALNPVRKVGRFAQDAMKAHVEANHLHPAQPTGAKGIQKWRPNVCTSQYRSQFAHYGRSCLHKPGSRPRQIPQRLVLHGRNISLGNEAAPEQFGQRPGVLMQLGAALPELMQDGERSLRDCSQIPGPCQSPVHVQRLSGGATELARSGHGRGGQQPG